jgi:hypothetical protein
VINHTGARNFSSHIHDYLEEEAKAGAIIGPFHSSPFEEPITISPLNTVPKKDTNKRRVIVDLSFPDEGSVNSGIDKNRYLGEEVHLKYPSVDNLVDIVRKKGRDCLLFKRDLKRAYRQIPIDPGDMHLMGYRWKNHIFVDRVLPMGLRSAALICQRVTNAVNHMAHKQGIDIVNYLDDFGGADNPEVADEKFKKLGGLLKQCGLEESEQKASPPSTRMMFLGIQLDTHDLTLSIDEDRIEDSKQLFEDWMKKSHASLKEAQSLLGKVQFIATCVRPGRIFVSRLLNWIRTIKSQSPVHIPAEVLLDVKWWLNFLPVYNGVSMMPMVDWSQPDEILATDACLIGCGGTCGNEFYHAVFPEFIQRQSLHINALEMLALVVGLKLWKKKLRGARLMIHCDNEASVTILNSGATRDVFLQGCLREIVLLAAVGEFEVRAKHIPGVKNRIPDLLSRWEIVQSAAKQLAQIQGAPRKAIQASEDLFKFTHEW